MITRCNVAGLSVGWYRSGTDLLLWERFKQSASDEYARRGCANALHWEDDTGREIFFCVVSCCDDLLGGFSIRVSEIEQLRAPYCWAEPDYVLACVRAEVGSETRVAEAFAAWSTDRITSQLMTEQSQFALSVARCRWMVATSAQHSIGLWLRSGAYRVKGVAAVRYPDDRYETELLIWDRQMLIDDRRIA